VTSGASWVDGISENAIDNPYCGFSPRSPHLDHLALPLIGDGLRDATDPSGADDRAMSSARPSSGSPAQRGVSHYQASLHAVRAWTSVAERMARCGVVSIRPR